MNRNCSSVCWNNFAISVKMMSISTIYLYHLIPTTVWIWLQFLVLFEHRLFSFCRRCFQFDVIFFSKSFMLLGRSNGLLLFFLTTDGIISLISWLIISTPVFCPTNTNWLSLSFFQYIVFDASLVRVCIYSVLQVLPAMQSRWRLLLVSR